MICGVLDSCAKDRAAVWLCHLSSRFMSPPRLRHPVMPCAGSDRSKGFGANLWWLISSRPGGVRGVTGLMPIAAALLSQASDPSGHMA